MLESALGCFRTQVSSPEMSKPSSRVGQRDGGFFPLVLRTIPAEAFFSRKENEDTGNQIRVKKSDRHAEGKETPLSPEGLVFSSRRPA
jgi:hypothetical protein